MFFKVTFLCVICDGTSAVSELIFMPHLVYSSIYIVLKEQVLKISFIMLVNVLKISIFGVRLDGFDFIFVVNRLFQFFYLD